MTLQQDMQVQIHKWISNIGQIQSRWRGWRKSNPSLVAPPRQPEQCRRLHWKAASNLDGGGVGMSTSRGDDADGN
jgi:hypothetical protein